MRGKPHECKASMSPSNVLRIVRKFMENPLQLASAIIWKGEPTAVDLPWQGSRHPLRRKFLL